MKGKIFMWTFELAVTKNSIITYEEAKFDQTTDF